MKMQKLRTNESLTSRKRGGEKKRRDEMNEKKIPAKKYH
jgi:hypothetical protein